MPGEILLLHWERRPVPVTIQAGLANADHARLLRQRAAPRPSLLVPPRRPRWDGCRRWRKRPGARRPGADAGRGSRPPWWRRQSSARPRPRGASTGQDRRQVGAELLGVQMSMRVDENGHVRPPRARDLRAGTGSGAASCSSAQPGFFFFTVEQLFHDGPSPRRRRSPAGPALQGGDRGPPLLDDQPRQQVIQGDEVARGEAGRVRPQKRRRQTLPDQESSQGGHGRGASACTSEFERRQVSPSVGRRPRKGVADVAQQRPALAAGRCPARIACVCASITFLPVRSAYRAARLPLRLETRGPCL